MSMTFIRIGLDIYDRCQTVAQYSDAKNKIHYVKHLQ